MKASKRLSSIEGLGVEWARSLQPCAPQPQIRLETADPMIKLPQELLKFAQALAVEERIYRYTDFRGIPKLRQAVANHLAAVHSLRYDPETEILITSGSTEANFLAVFSTVDLGEPVLLLDPSYANFRTYAEANGAKLVYARTDSRNHWEINATDFKKKITRCSPAAMVIAVPNNPTGTVPSQGSFNLIREACLRKRMWLIYDTVFDLAVFSCEKLPNLSDLKSQLIVTGGTSKVYGLTGCRVGWLAGPAELVAKIGKSIKLATSICANSYGQEISAFMLENGNRWISVWVEKWSATCRRLMEALEELPVCFCPPDGGYFLFVDFGRIERSSFALAEYLIRQFGLFTSPGADYGKSGEGHLRMVYASLNEQGIQQLVKTLKQALTLYPTRNYDGD